jgi:hypothetical protein
MADLGRVKEVLAGIDVRGIRGLTARQNGSDIEIIGEADNVEAKQSVTHILMDKLGDRTGINDLIRVPSDPGRGGQAEGVASVHSVPTGTTPRQ